MQRYVYNTGLEAAKIMNSLHAAHAALSSLRAFLSGDTMAVESKAVYTIKAALPQALHGLTGPLFLQGVVARSFESNTYLGATGSVETPAQLVVQNDMRFVKMEQFMTGSELALRNKYVFGVSNHTDPARFEPSFYLNTSNHKDSVNIVFSSILTSRGGWERRLIAFSADSYNSSFSQSHFAGRLESYLSNVSNRYQASSGSLQSAFESMVLECANFADVSYSLQEARSQRGDLSPDVADAFEHFADIDLTV